MAMLKVGGARVKAVKEARKAILDILKAGRLPDVTIEALKAFVAVCAVNTTITNCTFTTTSKKK